MSLFITTSLLAADPLGGAIAPTVGGSVTVGFPRLISNLITLAIAIGGLLILLNFISAGYDFLTASGDPKKVQTALTKIWQSAVGFLIIVSAIAIITVLGQVFHLPNILQPTIFGPSG